MKEEEGGRKKPFTTGYRPQIFLRTADTACEVKLPDSHKIALPGDNISLECKLAYPISVYEGQRFALREGGKTVAAGVISKVLPSKDLEEDLGLKKKSSAKMKLADEKKA